MSEDKEVIEKYHFELKWASYFLIWFVVYAIVFSIIIEGYDNCNVTENDFLGYKAYHKPDHSYFLNYLFFIQFFYFLNKGIKDAKSNKIIFSFFSKLLFTIRSFGFNFLMLYFIFMSYGNRTEEAIINKFEYIENYMLEDNRENKSNFLNDFINFIKRRKN